MGVIAVGAHGCGYSGKPERRDSACSLVRVMSPGDSRADYGWKIGRRMAATSDPRARLTVVVISLVQFIVVLESLSVSVALPAVGTDLHLGANGLTWVLQAYMLSYGGFLGVAGRAGDLFGHRRMLHGGLVLFGIASFGAGVATSPTLLLVARTLQGLGAALILPPAMSLLVAGRSENDKARALAVWSAVGGAGVITGAVVGGVVTDVFGWRWLFLGNIPVVALVLVASPMLLDGRHTGPRHRLDIPGALLLSTGVAAVLYALPSGEAAGRFDADRIAALVSGLFLLGGFVWRQRRGEEPLIPDRVLKARARRAASLGAVALNGGFACILVFGSAQLQGVFGYSPLKAGLALLPLALLAAVTTRPAAYLCRHYRRTRVAVAGLACMALGFGLLTLAAAEGGYWAGFLPGTVLFGVGMSTAYVPLTLLAVGAVDDGDRGIASGVYNTFGQVGSAVVLAVVTTAATLAPGGREVYGAISADFIRNVYWTIAILLFLGAVFTWRTARRSRDAVVPAPPELLKNDQG